MRLNKPAKIITHHAWSGKNYTVEMCDRDHKARWPGFVSRLGYHVGYHYFIDWEGNVTKTREYNEEGAHTLGQNTSSIGVCFAGNFDKHFPSKRQEKAWQEVYKEIGGAMPTYPHRKYSSKSCHGALLEDDYFAKLVATEYRVQMIEKITMLISKLQALILQRRMK